MPANFTNSVRWLRILRIFTAPKRLVIELDGGQHYTEEGEKSDRERTVYLEKHHAVMVVRFSNREIHQNFRGVCEKIEELLRFRIHRT